MIDQFAAKFNEFLPTEPDVASFAREPSFVRYLDAFKRVPIWCHFLRQIYADEDTSVLLSAANSKIIESSVLLPISLLHCAYVSLRTALDICVSYTFYKSHPVEWRAICTNRGTWLNRSEIFGWHSKYTAEFKPMNGQFGFANSLESTYRELSAYVHGIPVGGLPTLKRIEKSRIPNHQLIALVELAEKMDRDLSLLFLTVFHSDAVVLSHRDLRTIFRGIDRTKLAAAGIRVPRP